MFEKFTDRARKAMAFASQIAQEWQHEYIGPEHMLLGCIKVGGMCESILKYHKISPNLIAAEIEKTMKAGSSLTYQGEIKRTPRAKIAIEQAINESRRANDNYVGTEHLLMGLIYDESNVPSFILRSAGLSYNKIMEAKLKILDMEDAKNMMRNIGLPVFCDPVKQEADAVLKCSVIRLEEPHENETDKPILVTVRVDNKNELTFTTKCRDIMLGDEFDIHLFQVIKG